MKIHRQLGLWLWALGLTPLLAQAAWRPLVDFSESFDLAAVRRTDASIGVTNLSTGAALRIHTGQQERWPGVTLHAPGGHWDLSAYAFVSLRVKNVGTNLVTVYCRVDNPGADGKKYCVTDSVTLAPGQTNTLKVRLSHESGDTLNGKLFGMRGYPVRRQNADALQVSNITQLVLFVKKSPTDHEFAVAAVQATGEHTPPTAWVTDAESFFPFIDSFGQYKHKDWPGKVHSLAELQARRTTEAAELAAQPGPTNWDEYGGWNGGPRRAATGFFRTEKVDGKWWLVDPAGNLFWSHGIDCVRLLDATPIAERETWFDDLPADSAATHEFFGRHFALKGHYAGHEVATFNFTGLNLQRKYGPEWRQVYPAVAHQRLRSWGLNTIGNWSDPDIYRQHRTPYTDTISSSGATMIAGSTGYWGKFPDVFAASFAATLRRAMASKSATSANDPWCLGYFSDNEMSWGDATALAQAALQSPTDQAAKLEFLRDLKVKYANIGALNAVWGTHHASWDALLASRLAPDKQKAQADLTAFEEKLAATYFHSVREAIKSVAPHQLYLGCRFAAVNDTVAQAAAKDCDVVSYNLYRQTIADFQFPGGDKSTNYLLGCDIKPPTEAALAGVNCRRAIT